VGRAARYELIANGTDTCGTRPCCARALCALMLCAAVVRPQTFDVDPNDKVERKKRKSKAELDAASTKRRLASGLIASPAGAPPTVAGGRLGRFYLPDPDAADVSAVPAVVQHVRDYNLAIDVVRGCVFVVVLRCRKQQCHAALFIAV
jgi:hypothetical protein